MVQLRNDSNRAIANSGWQCLTASGSGPNAGTVWCRVDGSTVTGNTITGSGAHAIYATSPAKPNSGKHVIYGNTVTGYLMKLFIDMALHPGAVLEGKE
jgi:hypothetical protein